MGREERRAKAEAREAAYLERLRERYGHKVGTPPAGRQPAASVPDPMLYLFSGVAMQVVGGICIAVGIENEESALVVLGACASLIGSLIMLIGVVAHGVVLGMRVHRHESARQARALPHDTQSDLTVPPGQIDR